MTRDASTVIVEKIPLENAVPDHPKRFGRMPQLYLEFFENPRRIKQHLVGRHYEPPQHIKPDRCPIPKVDYMAPSYSLNKEMHTTSPPDSPDNSGQDSAASSPISPPLSFAGASSGSVSPLVVNEEHEEEGEEEEASSEFASDERSTPTASVASSTQRSQAGSRASRSRDQIFRLLHSSTPLNQKMKEKYASPMISPSPQNGGGGGRLPTLNELEKQNRVSVQREYADATRLKNDNEDLKREMLFKFDLLKKSYPKASFPSFTIYDDLTIIQNSYNDTLRMLSLDSSVENYKTYLTFVFMGLEWALGKWLKLEMDGYTAQQLSQMHKYEKLLLELGEKNYVPSGKQWPVEVRLLIIVLINTAFFVISKSIFRSAGASILNMVNEAKMPPRTQPAANTSASAPTTPPAASSEPARKKMKGPEIDFNSLPDFS